jgi:DnaJ-class molecular chaperone
MDGRTGGMSCQNLGGREVTAARKAYRSYVEAGVEQGKRPELVGGGLTRSLGGMGGDQEERIIR